MLGAACSYQAFGTGQSPSVPFAAALLGSQMNEIEDVQPSNFAIIKYGIIPDDCLMQVIVQLMLVYES